jgi:hypothetical protein
MSVHTYGIRLLLGLSFFAALIWAGDEDVRPACSTKTQGTMWPAAANHDRSVISRLARCGELLICVRGTWHYHWEPASVTIEQLTKKPNEKPSKPAGCNVQPVAGNSAATSDN